MFFLLCCKGPLWLCFQKSGGKVPTTGMGRGGLGTNARNITEAVLLEPETSHSAKIISLVFKLKRKFQATRHSATYMLSKKHLSCLWSLKSTFAGRNVWAAGLSSSNESSSTLKEILLSSQSKASALTVLPQRSCSWTAASSTISSVIHSCTPSNCSGLIKQPCVTRILNSCVLKDISPNLCKETNR